jgi:hypothetical protein
LVLSELGGNALRHGGEAAAAIGWRLTGDRLLISVADASAASLAVVDGNGTREDGRGLFLVALLAEEWVSVRSAPWARRCGVNSGSGPCDGQGEAHGDDTRWALRPAPARG